MDSVVETIGLTKRYGQRAAVADLSLHVEAGEIYAFLGLNGAGKTTTIRMLLGMVRPTAGTARLFGRAVEPGAQGVWSDVGYLVESPSAYPDLTVRENLEVARRLRLIRDRDVVDRAIERLGLGAYADQRAGTLSLGNAQRLGLAKALFHRPRLLVLDEPANGLDPAGVVEIREMLLDLAHGEGVTVFLSSHILSEVAHLAARIGIIHEGRLIREIDAGHFDRRRWLLVDARDRDAARATLESAGFTVGPASDGAIRLTSERAVDRPDDVARLLVEAGASPTRLDVQEEDLETYFLDLVRSREVIK